MPRWLHRSTKRELRSIASADLPEPQSNYIEAPDLSAVAGFDRKYWTITGDLVTLMTPAERALVDAADLAASRDSLSGRIDQNESYDKAFALLVLGEFNHLNGRVNAILDAISAATNLNTLQTAIALINSRADDRALADLKTALRNKLDE